MQIAQWIVFVVSTYSAIGLVFGASFAIFGVGRVDPAAHGASLAFRLIILPGAAALWPIVAIKWITARPERGVE